MGFSVPCFLWSERKGGVELHRANPTNGRSISEQKIAYSDSTFRASKLALSRKRGSIRGDLFDGPSCRERKVLLMGAKDEGVQAQRSVCVALT